MIAVADLAVGKNLTGQGILEGVVENIAGAGLVPVVAGEVTTFEPIPTSPPGAESGQQQEAHTLEFRPERDGPVIVPLAAGDGEVADAGDGRFDERLFWEIVRAMKGGHEAANWFQTQNGKFDGVKPRTYWQFPLWLGTMWEPSQAGMENVGGFGGGQRPYFLYRKDLDELQAALEFMKQMSGGGDLGTSYLGWLPDNDPEQFRRFYQETLRLEMVRITLEGSDFYLNFLGGLNGGAAAGVLLGNLQQGKVVDAAAAAGGYGGSKLVAKLRKAAKLKKANPPTANVPKGKGEYSKVGGHHVHGKAGFKSHSRYDPEKGFSIGQDYMKSRGWDHQAMTNKQRELFNELARSGRPNTMKEHTRIAVEALMAGGASREEARALVAESLRNLREQGVRIPTDIPWNWN